MSFDLKIATVCDHKVHWESATLDDDRQSLRVQRPIASNISVEVFSSGNSVPKSEYIIKADPNTIDVNQPTLIYFKEKEKATDNFYEVNYVTIKGYCPKCAGLQELDDIQFTPQGDYARIRDEFLLMQNVEKFTITELRSNIFHTYLGTGLVDLLGKKITDPNYFSSKIVQEISTTLSKFQDLQKQYENSGRTVTDGEMLETVNDIEVSQDNDDPTIFYADVSVTARSGKTVNFTQTLRTRA